MISQFIPLCQPLSQNTVVGSSAWVLTNCRVWTTALDRGPLYWLLVQGLLAGDVVDVRVFFTGDPLSSDAGTKFGPDLTEDGQYPVDSPYGWLKVRRTAIGGGGTVNATLGRGL